MTETFVEYVKTATGRSSVRAIATDIGMTHTTVGNHLRDATPDIATVLKIARRFNLELVPLFLAAGYITDVEAEQFRAPTKLSEYSELELSKEMLRRVAAGTAGPTLTEPVSETVIDDVLREVENAREQEHSTWALAAESRRDRTPKELDSDDQDRDEV
ncbi:hypothetical protein [Paramicrobacterium chengjingii]|uniref:HTH cro/C1-type domain-containing protein n=1 Tax=Paramicrobacterium chengjingii TaxID=2769067 RepID=A0ABX6YN63_9MICO|nr:hypothetical protein [Microbacterium chengjingii]QPZ39735.1 hypothetical protein HCR76_06730 [Microbacterium chengjingii]